jgi:hypothetical protein
LKSSPLERFIQFRLPLNQNMIALALIAPARQ